MPVVGMPDGTQVQFPDSMPPAQIKALILSKFPDAGNPPAPLATPVPGFVPGQAPTPDQIQQLAANWGKTNSGSMPPESAAMQPAPDVVPPALRAFSENAVNSVPIAGPLLQKARGAVMGPEGEAQMEALGQRASAAAPAAATAGSVFGTVAPFVAGGEIPIAAKFMGMDAAAVPSLFGRSLLSAGSMGSISAADALARGQNPGQIAQAGGIGALGGVVAPGVGALAGGALNKLGTIGKTIQATWDPKAAKALADRAVGNAAVGDIASGQPFINAQDEADAAANGQPLANIDRFGEGIRTLGRAAGNLSPDAKALLTGVTVPRQAETNQRAINFIQSQFGDTNSFAARQALQDASRAANKPAYLAAYSDPNAHAIFTPEIANLMNSQDFTDAIPLATRLGNNDAALRGYPAVKNPFRMNSDGSYTLVKQPDGSTAVPNLQFWDNVQRALGTNAQRLGLDDYQGAQNEQLRQALNAHLDDIVPAFQDARQGAAKFFNAKDALEAGQNFTGTSLSDLPGAQDAYSSMTPPDQKLFNTGFGSSLIDKVGQVAQNRASVIDNIFGSPQAKAQMNMVMGADGTAKMEAFLRLEHTMQQSNTAIARNSSTAAQQAAMAALGGYAGGVGTGGGFNPREWKPGNWGSAAAFAGAGRFGAKYLGAKVNNAVMGNIAQTLASRDPDAINQIVQNSVRSPQTQTAIRAIEHGMQALTQGGATTAPAMIAPPAATDTTLTPPGLGL